MNDHWNVPGATTVVSLHQNQQHQLAATVQTENLPHHLPTTPDWTIKNTAMMEEAIEDKNNDSGVSPGHYETSPSPEQRSSENRSPSSCSGTSHESHLGPPANYPYTPQQSHLNGEVAMDYAKSQSDPQTPKSQGNTGGEMVAVSNSMKRRRERPVSRVHRTEFECPLCGFKTLERDVFWEHLKIHYNPNRLEDEPPVPKTIAIPGCTPEEIAERIAKHEEGINFPVLNNQGKIKVNHCKICRFRALTKVEFWRHIKLHIKLEKRLCCQYCPFVTDLKHHYEYHMNKQTGAKPFSCKLCKYSCVNKSMLSSHMKSHTDVRQFSCADCPYVTKYCHSVKMHLRKYAHEPGPILNPDGTVNTTITIDVYGTRRGPKQKKVALKSIDQSPRSTPQLQLSPSLPSSDMSTAGNDVKPFQDSSSMPMVVLSQSSLSNASSPMMINTMPMVNPFSGAGLNSVLASQYNNILRAGFPIAQSYANNGEITTNNINQMRTNILAEYLRAAERIRAANAASTNPQLIQNYYNNQSYINVPQPVADIHAKYTNTHEQNVHGTFQVLDLSRHSNASSSSSSNNNNDICSSGSCSNVEDHQISHPGVVNQRMNLCAPYVKSPSKPSGTSRRKGRAVKLNRRTMNNDTDDDIQSEDNAAERTSPESCVSSENTNDFGYNATETNNMITLKCAYCPISFGSEAMYTIHMGYHGYNDPYTCNICGQRCEDALSFNVHLSRSSHN